MISIIIPTYNKLELLRKCVYSILMYTNLQDIEIIIVSNGCKDGTVKWLQEMDQSIRQLKFMHYDEPLGYPKAINKGLEAAQGEYVILLNNDCQLLEQGVNIWIDYLLEPMQDPTVGITAPMIGYSEPADAWFAIFFCVMIRREVFSDIGRLDESFGVGGGEDTAFCIEAQRKGWKMIPVPHGNLSYNNGIAIGSFPIYHKGEGTVHDKELVPNWQEIFDNNSHKLRTTYNTKWILSNNCERAVIDATEDMSRFPRERARYEWATDVAIGNVIAEFGCSSGYGLRFLKKIPDLNYIGVDYDSNIIEYAKTQFPDYQFIHADIHDVLKRWKETYSEPVDTIICFECIEHLHDGKDIAQELKKYANCVMLTVPYKEPPGFWGQHHLMHNLTQSDFPGYEYLFMDEYGNISKEPKGEILNLMLMRWVKL